VSELTWLEQPTLRRPILLLALAGLFDVAEVATTAVAHLAAQPGARVVATIDPERFYDFTSSRPTVRLDAAGQRRIEWPANDLVVVASPEGAHDLVVVSGIEPHLRWRTFADTVVAAATTFGCELVVTLGAAAAAVPHTRRPRVVGSSTTDGLVRRLGLSRPTYEGMTGLIGVLLEALDRAGLPAVSLRVPVPHYALGTPHPQAVQALLLHVEHVTGAPTGHAQLDDEVALHRRRIDAAAADDDTVRHYVENLEQRYDAEVAQSLPSGDELAAQLERFLREQDE
jgi:proteasome assembly chaperone (PAC2) family protein